MFTLPALLCIGLVVAELALWLPFTLPSASRKLPALVLACLLPPLTILFCLFFTNVFSFLLVFVAFYRTVNMARLSYGRRQADHLYRASKRASLWLCSIQIITIGLVLYPSASVRQTMAGLFYGVTVVASVVLFTSLTRALRTTRPEHHIAMPEKELPTISVLIPARDETNDLSECLTTLINCTYPKLEIIVLDDRSQNKRTPEIIKGFAHDGVRFIAGKVPPKAWLAKNFAYQQLADVASGDVLLFCGVDTRFTPRALEQMVGELVQRDKTMVSFMPANTPPSAFAFESLFVQPARYAWELALPRRFLQRPPVLSTAWMIRRESLIAAGGFASASRAIVPERFLARYTLQHGDGYSFQQSTTDNGVASLKSFSEQQATAIRTRYPQLHQSLQLTALTSLLEFSITVVPFVLVVVAVVTSNTKLLYYGLFVCLLMTLMYVQVVSVTYRKTLVRSFVLLPLAALYDIILLNYSMFLYEFRDVNWKGQNVTVPVMQIIDKLPEA